MKKGFIEFANLLEFFSMNSFYPYEEELIAILRRYDKGIYYLIFNYIVNFY